MTKEELDVLYQDIIDNKEYQEKLETLKNAYKNSNDSYTYELLKNVVETCKNRILDNINDLSFYILRNCISISTELDADICDFSKQYCNDYEETGKLTRSYGVAARIAFLITKDTNWFFKYVKTFCDTEVWRGRWQVCCSCHISGNRLPMKQMFRHL